MTRATYVMRDGELVDIRDAEPLYPTTGRGPILIGDNIPDSGGRDVLNPADGRHYSSRTAFYEATKRAGGTITGTQKHSPGRREVKPQGVGQDVKRAIAELQSR